MVAHLSLLSPLHSHDQLAPPSPAFKRAPLAQVTSPTMTAQAHSFEFVPRSASLYATEDNGHMYAGLPSPNKTPAHSEVGQWVTITSIPRDVRAPEVWIKTLCSPFGPVERVLLASTQAAGDRIDTAFVRFARAEQAVAALQLNGREVPGERPLLASLTATLPPSGSPFQQSSAAPIDHVHNQLAVPQATHAVSQVSPHTGGSSTRNEYRNLYVLNLPLDATTDQLAALFASYGEVTHCVILSMMDRAARRRGFIDMGSHEQAREAIQSLNGYVWNGYPIEVSYAIVQRSNGPLSGPNTARRTVPRSRWNCGPRKQPIESSSPLSSSSDYGSSPFSLSRYDVGQQLCDPLHASPAACLDSVGPQLDPCTISINGLDPVAIIDDDDLFRHLSLYGRVVACSLSRGLNGYSLGHAVANFADAADAAFACQQLNGRQFNDRILTCQFIPRSNGEHSVPSIRSLSQQSMESSVLPDDARRDSWWTTSPCSSDILVDAPKTRELGPRVLDTSSFGGHSAMGRSVSEDSKVSSMSQWNGFPASATWPSIYTDSSGVTTDSDVPTTRSEPWLFRSAGPVLGDRTNVWGSAPNSNSRRRGSDDSQRDHDYGPIGSGSPRGTDMGDISSSPPGGGLAHQLKKVSLSM